MIDFLRSFVKNKKVLILGFGREGRASFDLLREAGGYLALAVSDMKNIEDLPEDVTLHTGDDYLSVIDDYDIIFKTPGIVMPKELKEYKAFFTSETELFIERYRDRIIGITGTKGKSTTSTLLYETLKDFGLKVLFAGNIGIPVFDIWKEIDDDTLIVLELSCHQLEYAVTSPKYSMILNIYEDHLDHYGTRERYAKSKLNLPLYQKETDLFLTTKEVTDEFGEFKVNTVHVDKSILPIKSLNEINKNLKGEHNLLNAAFVYSMAGVFGVTLESFLGTLSRFNPLPHRLEYAGCFNGVDFYDDSISTTVKSAISACESVENSETILIGGMERNIDYTELVSYLKKSKLKNIICMYESGERFYEMYKKALKFPGAPKAYLKKDLNEAVSFAKEITGKGGAVLLSPAAASYGYFKNFEERGDKFKNLVKC
jgi:UDP-N-acetylmuramoylalanine--D-glutamate ligase